MTFNRDLISEYLNLIPSGEIKFLRRVISSDPQKNNKELRVVYTDKFDTIVAETILKGVLTLISPVNLFESFKTFYGDEFDNDEFHINAKKILPIVNDSDKIYYDITKYIPYKHKSVDINKNRPVTMENDIYDFLIDVKEGRVPLEEEIPLDDFNFRKPYFTKIRDSSPGNVIVSVIIKRLTRSFIAFKRLEPIFERWCIGRAYWGGLSASSIRIFLPKMVRFGTSWDRVILGPSFNFTHHIPNNGLEEYDSLKTILVFLNNYNNIDEPMTLKKLYKLYKLDCSNIAKVNNYQNFGLLIECIMHPMNKNKRVKMYNLSMFNNKEE